MRRPIILVVVGFALLVGAIAGFVIVPEHKPQFTSGGGVVIPGDSSSSGYFSSSGVWTGWSHIAYDAARIGTWALLIAGAILVAVGLMGYARLSQYHSR